MKIYFLTGNRNKYLEAKRIFEEFNLKLDMKRYRKVEIQSNSLEEIVRYAVLKAAEDFSETFVIEDDGLFIECLNGFPGPYSAYVYRTLGLVRILKLMEHEANRRAYFKSVVGLFIPRLGIRVFTGISEGRISMKLRGEGGFGYDPIFIPDGSEKTFAEMSVNEKNRFSHRAKAFRKVCSFLKELRS